MVVVLGGGGRVKPIAAGPFTIHSANVLPTFWCSHQALLEKSEANKAKNKKDIENK